MPLITNKSKPLTPSTPSYPAAGVPGPQKVVHAHKAYRGVTVDTEYQPRQNIIMHVEGSPWTVNYYSQMLGFDNATQGQGLGTLGINQQYKLIRSMEIRVQSELSASQNGETKEMIYTGSAIVFPFVIPNEGDIFIADVGDGHEGVFQITQSTRKSIYREACHEIEYTMLDYSTGGRLEDLDKKVVQTLHFERDFIKHGHNPLLFENVFNYYIVLRDAYPRLVDLYLRRYYSQEFTTLIVPDQPEYTYDPFLTRGYNAHFGRWDSNTFKHIRVLNADEDSAMTAYSIWDAIAHRDRLSLNSAFQRAGLVSVKKFNARSAYDGIRFSGISKTIYPEDPMHNAQAGIGWEKKDIEPFQRAVLTAGPRRMSDFMALNASQLKTVTKVAWDDPDVPYTLNPSEPVKLVRREYTQEVPDDSVVDPDPQNPDSPPTIPAVSKIIHPAMQNGYYMFSKAFWENDRTPGAQSKLELVVQDYFDKKAISYERLHEIYLDSFNWNALDSFYYVPVLLVMMKVVILTV